MTFFRSTILYGLLLTLLACGSDPVGAKKSGDNGDDAGDTGDDTADDESDSEPSGSTKDAGKTTPSSAKDAGGAVPSGAKDAGAPKPETHDSGAAAGGSTDGGAKPVTDAGKAVDGADAVKDGGGGLSIPDLLPSAADGGTSTGAPATGARDVNGPCKDLQLLCFDIFDMWIINPSDCGTCNAGKGCQGCAIPFAY
jgi:hypothetical protein